MKKLFKKIIFIIIILICILYIIKVYFIKFGPVECESNDPKICALYEANNKLNSAYSRKDWEEIYTMKLKIFKSGLYKYKPIKESFYNRMYKVYFWSVLNMKMISFEILDNEIKTINYLEGRFIFWPFKVYKLNVYHYWQYKDGEWFLVAHGRSDSGQDDEIVVKPKIGNEL